MSREVYKKGIFFAFLAYALLCAAHAAASTVVFQEKEVQIDPSWRITGHYHYEFEVLTAQGERAVRGFVRQVQQKPSLYPNAYKDVSVRIVSPDGELSGDPAKEKDIAKGSLVAVRFTVEASFPGFEGLFADYFSLDQAAPARKAEYTIRFPASLPFACRIRQGDDRFEKEMTGDHFHWSGTGVRKLELMITTAESWESVSQRYNALYADRYGRGLSFDQLPEAVSAAGNRSTEQKMEIVFDFLQRHFSYRSHALLEHALLPASPKVVLERGWGDCKDLTLLSTALLRSLKIDAFVLLTGAPKSGAGGGPLPDPFLFDHAVLGVKNNGRVSYYELSPAASKIETNSNTVRIEIHL